MRLYNKKMRYHLIILSLIAIVYINSQKIVLTPILPASAFENEFYQVRFRVRNMMGARFEFKNLPSFFTASSEGLLSGVPTKQGLYAIEVVYLNQTYKESKEVIIDVRRGTKLTNYNTGAETQQLPDHLRPKQQYLFTYNQNDELHIELNITNGQAPFTFQSIYIPNEMDFNNKTGSISGAFRKYGDYVIGIKVRDSRNMEIQVLIKISVAIKNTTTPKFIFYQRSLLPVKFQLTEGLDKTPKNSLPNNDTKNTPNPKNSQGGSVNLPLNNQPNSGTSQIPAQSQTSIQSLNTIKTNQFETPNQIPIKTSFDPTTLPSNTQPSINTIQPINPSKTPSTNPVIPQSAAKQAQSIPPPKQIVSTQNIINKNITTDVNMEQIQKQKDRLNKKLIKSKQALKVCYQNVQTMRKTVENYLSAYNDQFAKVDKLRNQLQELRTKSQRAGIDLEQKLARLKTLQIEKMLAEKQMIQSRLSFQNVNCAYNGSVTNIKKNFEVIQNLQNKIQSYKRDLDNSYKALDEAMTLNSKYQEQNLQVREGIKKGMGLFALVNSTKTHKFGGCENYKFYQKSIGVGQVKKVIDRIYLLTNNMIITFGQCTESQIAKPGDIIEWKGYLQNGAVSALVIKKLK